MNISKFKMAFAFVMIGAFGVPYVEAGLFPSGLASRLRSLRGLLPPERRMQEFDPPLPPAITLDKCPEGQEYFTAAWPSADITDVTQQKVYFSNGVGVTITVGDTGTSKARLTSWEGALFFYSETASNLLNVRDYTIEDNQE